MSWSKEEALTDPAVREPLIFVSEFRFRLKDIPTEITVCLYRPLHSGRMVARRSHDLVIPNVTPPPAPDSEEADGEGAALHLSVNELVQMYNSARAQGLAPDDSWLKPNDEFY